tara:strand:- start:673 stop:885 length:213 start_codon:yes stop_codon:yes gene_type:complete
MIIKLIIIEKSNKYENGCAKIERIKNIEQKKILQSFLFSWLTYLKKKNNDVVNKKTKREYTLSSWAYLIK